ncbi:MAG TPA: hypothetical protein VF337_00325 [Candidatus Limnocylindrales bacterium]
MARAKRTDRAEARRKYRAYLQAQEDGGVADDEGSDSSADSGQKPARRSHLDSPPPQPGARLGIVAAAKGAYRQAHYIDDIKSLRHLIFNTNAIWPALLICLASGTYLAFRLRTSDWASDAVTMALFQFIFIPPLIPPMLAGFFAPRATWLAGATASLFATLTLFAVLGISSVAVGDVSGANASASPTAVASASTSPSAQSSVTATTAASTSAASASAVASTSPSASPSSSTTSNTGTSSSDLITSAFFMILQSLTIGAGIGALSGWYKRFLALTSGPGKPRSPKSGSQRNAQRRRPATTRK